jgi:hypothetical protein
MPLVPLVGLGIGSLIALGGVFILLRRRDGGPATEAGAAGAAGGGTGATAVTTAAGPDLLLGATRGRDDLRDCLRRRIGRARTPGRRRDGPAPRLTRRRRLPRRFGSGHRGHLRPRGCPSGEPGPELEGPDTGPSSISSGGLTLTEHDLRLLDEAPELRRRTILAATRAGLASQRGGHEGVPRRLDLRRPDTVESLRQKACTRARHEDRGRTGEAGRGPGRRADRAPGGGRRGTGRAAGQGIGSRSRAGGRGDLQARRGHPAGLRRMSRTRGGRRGWCRGCGHRRWRRRAGWRRGGRR